MGPEAVPAGMEPEAADVGACPLLHARKTWAVGLCVRGTFLDFVDPVPIGAARRSSDPGLHGPQRHSFFAEEEAYARQLQEQLHGPGAPPEEEPAEEKLVTPSASARSSLLSARSWVTASASRAERPEGAPLSDDPPTDGSIGHPVLCRPPCMDVASCHGGCSRCHLPHPVEARRQRALDKINRRTLRLMGRGTMVEALLGVLRPRVAGLGLGEGAARALEAWQVDVAVAPPEVEECFVVPPRELRRLLRFLKTLYLNDLCFLPGPPDIRAASTRLIDRLRELCALA